MPAISNLAVCDECAYVSPIYLQCSHLSSGTNRGISQTIPMTKRKIRERKTAARRPTCELWAIAGAREGLVRGESRSSDTGLLTQHSRAALFTANVHDPLHI